MGSMRATGTEQLSWFTVVRKACSPVPESSRAVEVAPDAQRRLHQQFPRQGRPARLLHSAESSTPRRFLDRELNSFPSVTVKHSRDCQCPSDSEASNDSADCNAYLSALSLQSPAVCLWVRSDACRTFGRHIQVTVTPAGGCPGAGGPQGSAADRDGLRPGGSPSGRLGCAL